jgi:hypothetical protein
VDKFHDFLSLFVFYKIFKQLDGKFTAMLSEHGSKPLTPVIFKCHWFDPQVTRQTHSNLGIVEIRQDSTLPGDDVYIVA